MKKLKAKIGLKIIYFGLFIMSLEDESHYDDGDKQMLMKLHILKHDFEAAMR